MTTLHQHNMYVIAWMVLAIFLFVEQGVGQRVGGYPTAGSSSLDTPADPATIAMGESFVALPGNPAALMSNPAGLADLTGIQMQYAHRSRNLIESWEGMGYWNLYGSVTTSIGTLGMMYGRYSQDELGKSFMMDEMPYDDVISLGFGHQFGKLVRAGLAVKTYSIHNFGHVDKRPYLFDFGVQLSLPELIASSGQTDRFTIGVSAQNVGTDFTIFEVGYLQPFGSRATEVIIPLPQYLRAGFSYDFSVTGRDESSLSPFGLLATAEYRYLSNAGTGGTAPRDFWGVGFEARIMEVFRGRIGGFVQPSTNPYGERGVAKVRYGAGVNIPFSRLGWEVPMRFTFDYAGIPLRPVSVYGQVSVLHSFSASLAYDTELF